MTHYLFVVHSEKIQNYLAHAIKNLSAIADCTVWIETNPIMQPIKAYDWTKLELAVTKRNPVYCKNPLKEVAIENLVNECKNVVWKKSSELIIFDWIIPEDPTVNLTSYNNITKNGYVALEFSSSQIIQESILNETLSVSFQYKLPSESTWKHYCKKVGVEKGFKNNWDKVLWNFSIFIPSIILQDSTKMQGSEQVLISNKNRFITKLAIMHNQMILVIISLMRKMFLKKYNWKIAFENENKLHFLNQPAKSFWADPFFIEFNGVKALFFEELDKNGKGLITAVTMDDHFEIIDKQVIIEEDFHLSFPNIFIENNQLFMIPESSASGKVLLYECNFFPFQWTLKKTIKDDLKLIDMVWIKKDELYWIFANKIEDFEYDNNERLNLYYTSDILSGSWTSHPQNPIVVDKKSARNAGKIVNKSNKLIRLGQNCFKSYGSNLVFKEIEKMTALSYEEKVVKTIYPFKPYCGQHTWNEALNNYNVTDFLIKE